MQIKVTSEKVLVGLTEEKQKFFFDLRQKHLFILIYKSMTLVAVCKKSKVKQRNEMKRHMLNTQET